VSLVFSKGSLEHISVKMSACSDSTLAYVVDACSSEDCFFFCCVVYILHISCCIRAESSNIYEYPCMWRKKKGFI